MTAPAGKSKSKRSSGSPGTPSLYTIAPPAALQGYAKPLSKAELCDYLGCSPKYIEAQVAAGHLRATKLSSKMVRYWWQDVEDWLTSKRV
jgi:excisionase family DNA binding protein